MGDTIAEFKTAAKAVGLDNSTIDELIKGDCWKKDVLQHLQERDLEDFKLIRGQHVKLRKWITTLNNESTGRLPSSDSRGSLGSSGGNDIEDRMSQMSLSRSLPGSSRMMPTYQRTQSEGSSLSSMPTGYSSGAATGTATYMGTQKHPDLNKSIEILQASGLVVEQWEKLLRKLCMDDGIIKSIDINHRGEPQKCIHDGVTRWHETFAGSSVEGLVRTLKKCEFGKVAGDIEREVLKREVLVESRSTQSYTQSGYGSTDYYQD